jgi:ABC-type glycerol-3-phosphate transport system substrate-binding protein
MKRIILTATSVLALGAGAALADGSVTVYTATPQNFIDALVPAFEAKTGTKVEIIKAGSGELLNRLTAEASAPWPMCCGAWTAPWSISTRPCSRPIRPPKPTSWPRA